MCVQANTASANSVFIRDDGVDKSGPDPVEELQDQVAALKSELAKMAAMQHAMAVQILGQDSVAKVQKEMEASAKEETSEK